MRGSQGRLEAEQNSSEAFGCKSRKLDSDLATEVHIISDKFESRTRGWVDSQMT